MTETIRGVSIVSVVGSVKGEVMKRGDSLRYKYPNLKVIGHGLVGMLHTC